MPIGGRPTRSACRDGAGIVGTYFLRSNQLGGGDHVANAAYDRTRSA